MRAIARIVEVEAVLTNTEAKAAVDAANKVLNVILLNQETGLPRKREQVRLIAELIGQAVNACTIPNTLPDMMAVAMKAEAIINEASPD